MVPITKEAQRAELHKTIWRIANDLRGSVDGWDFKSYVLGMLFYRFISENLTAYLNSGERKAGRPDFDYAKLADAHAEFGRAETVAEKGFYILPSELFANVRERAAADANLNETLERVFRNIEGSAVGADSEDDLKGLFDDLDVNSARLGPTVAKRNEKLVKLLDAIGDLDLGDFENHTIDAFGDAYEYLMQMYASSAGKSGGEYYTPQEVSELLARCVKAATRRCQNPRPTPLRTSPRRRDSRQVRRARERSLLRPACRAGCSAKAVRVLPGPPAHLQGGCGMTGKHIELFLVEGVPGGITTAEIAGWTGHVLAGPRSDLGDVLKRAEAKRNGAYFLLGDDEEAVGGVRCYIGRTENFINRFRDHSAKKEFWDRVVLITAKDDPFTEGHWGYLEWRLVELARQAARVTLANGNDPQGRKLSEAQISDMEAFLEQLQIVLPVLGVNAIRTRTGTKAVQEAAADSPVFTLRNFKFKVEARAQQLGDEFTMLAGSQVVAVWAGTGKAESTKRAYASYRAQHQRLVADGSIQVRGDVGVLTRDIPFGSPSTAAAVALGRSSNGRLEWKSADGGTYGDWENRGVE